MTPERLQGTKLIELFKYLSVSRTIISMLIAGSDFERLTCVTGVAADGKEPHIVVDLPRGFKDVAEDQKLLQLNFNFNGPDKLEYLFTTKGGSYTDNELRLPLPDYVERLQRRKDFRMRVPMGTRMHFHIKQLKETVELINISLGGTFGWIRGKGETVSKRPLLQVRQPIYKIRIVFPGQSLEEGKDIAIQKAEVVRIETDKETHKHKYAFKFNYIDKNEKQKLLEHIYRIQREYLQNR